MGFVQKDAVKITLLSYMGMFLGYFNKAFLFILFLTTDEIGLLNLLLSVGLLFAQFCNLGTAFTLSKFFPFFRNSAKNNYGFLQYNVLIVTIGVFLFAILAIVFKDQVSSYYIAKSPDFVTYYYWYLPIGIAYIYFLLFDSYLRAMYKNLLSVFLFEVGLRIFTLVAILGYGFQWIDFDTLIKVSSLIYFIPTIVITIYLVRLKELDFRFWNIKIPKRFRTILIRFSMLSYFNTLGALLVTTIDAMMVAAYLGLKETGIYTTVVFITAFLQVPYRALTRMTIPMVAEYWKSKNMEKMQEIYQQTSSILLVISTTLFMYVWINREAVFYILKPEFVAGIPVFLYIMIGRLTDMYLGLNGAIFVSSKKYAFDLLFTFLLIGIVYTLNTLFIPTMGMSGAALGTMIALVVYNFGRAYFVWYEYRLHPFTKSQLIVLFLFVVNVVGYEFLPHLEGRWLDIFVRSLLFTGTFPLIIYYLKIEVELNKYIDKLAGKYLRKSNR